MTTDESKYNIEYDADTAALWLRIKGKRYMLVQASGELIAAEGHGIDDYYWSNPPLTCDEIKNILGIMAELLENKL